MTIILCFQCRKRWNSYPPCPVCQSRGKHATPVTPADACSNAMDPDAYAALEQSWAYEQCSCSPVVDVVPA